MIAKIKTIALSGINVIDIEVQVHFAKGLPGLTIVGLGDKAVNESRDRIKAVLSSMGLILPPSRITVNLAPADVIKEGSHFDLPIATGILVAMGVITQDSIENYIILGELSLDGEIRHVNGVLPAAMHAGELNCGIVCPFVNGKEAIWAGENVDIIASKNLLSCINHFKGRILISRPEVGLNQFVDKFENDISDVKGQHVAKRALEIAAAGGHNMLMIGAPGTGKSMLASRIITILPPLDIQEILEVSMIHSVAGLIKDGIISASRPFRSPHHSASMPSIIGGGRNAKPGEITIAHRGILFLDELPEYPRQILDSLRQPMETREALISRIYSKVTYPANFQLIAAMNPCYCGYFGDKNKQCGNVPKCVINYQSKISGPILDRIDMHVMMENKRHTFVFNDKDSENKETLNLESQNINNKNSNNNTLDYENETSETIRNRVINARKIQKERYQNYKISLNSEVDGKLLHEICLPKDKNTIEMLNVIADKLEISMRGMTKILRVARTIADLSNSENVLRHHILEAASYRKKLGGNEKFDS